MAELATGNRDDALDIVQDAMLNLVEKYAYKEPNDWRFLFFKILQNRITDWHRRKQIRTVITKLVNPFEKSNDDIDDQHEIISQTRQTPDQQLDVDLKMKELNLALSRLPVRQQQTFLLRALEGFSVQETAELMRCSDGSVKTHFSRAIRTLRSHLERFR